MSADQLIQRIDPALVEEADRTRPPTLVLHEVHHADPLFVERAGGAKWADPVECLLDLKEAKLEAQASEFLDYLKRRRKSRGL